MSRGAGTMLSGDGGIRCLASSTAWRCAHTARVPSLNFLRVSALGLLWAILSFLRVSSVGFLPFKASDIFLFASAVWGFLFPVPFPLRLRLILAICSGVNFFPLRARPFAATAANFLGVVGGGLAFSVRDIFCLVASEWVFPAIGLGRFFAARDIFSRASFDCGIPRRFPGFPRLAVASFSLVASVCLTPRGVPAVGERL